MNYSHYPESFKKLENLFLTIINAIEKPFIEFKEENEMISASQFCEKLLPVIKQNRPAVALDTYLRLEACVSLFADPLIKEMVILYNQEKKEESLSKFIIIITHHEELAIKVPQAIKNIYSHLKSSFTTKHTIELSQNLADSQGRLLFSMERAYELAELISTDVLSHIPDSQSMEDEDEVIQVLSNLGIFCKKNNNEEIINDECQQMDAMQSFNNFEEPVQQHILTAPIPAIGEGAIDGRTVRRLTKHYAVTRKELENSTCEITKGETLEFSNNENNFEEECDIECDKEATDDDINDEDFVENEEEEVEECICLEASIPVFCDEIVDEKDEIETDDNKSIDNIENDDDIPQEFEGENDLNKDQINDAFDLFF